jgi:hypothetical protein
VQPNKCYCLITCLFCSCGLIFPVLSLFCLLSSSVCRIPCRIFCSGGLVVIYDRTIMSPFCESAKMAAPPLNQFSSSKTAPPLPETTVHALTSFSSPFYKSHCSPRLWAAPSFPWPAWQFGPAIKPCSMDVSFLVSFL